MIATSVIEKLDKIVFHDLPIESINFISQGEIKLIVTASPYNENTNDYEKLKLIFSKITELKSDEIIFDNECDIELFHFEYVYDEIFKCKMDFLLGFGKPSLTIELTCREVEIKEYNQESNAPNQSL